MNSPLSDDAATFAWDDLAQRLERFIATWEQTAKPTLAQFLPTEPPAHRRLVLVELVKVDLEQRTSRQCPKTLDAYAAEFPELLDGGGEPPCDLIYEEYHIRRVSGETVSPREYYERFPKSADALRRLMGTDDPSSTTQLGAARRIEGLAAGQRLDDFDLLLELGRGAFGSVFLARQLSMQRLVALKVSADKGNEPQALATLEHPNIIRVYDQRILPERRVRLLYMQFAPGGTLAEVVHAVRETPADARSGELLAAAIREALAKAGGGEAAQSLRRLAATSWPETVCRLGIQLAQALDYAHRQGILHRDVKPANVLLSSDGTPKLADFNISFCSQLDGATPAAFFGGSLAYMSPEQIEACNPTHPRQAADLDGRSDLFALAVLLWELLYGLRPFPEDQLSSEWSKMLAELAGRRRNVPPSAPHKAADAVADRLTQVLVRALAPDPHVRHPDGAALARELVLCLNARAWDLVHDLPGGWRRFAQRYPVLALLPVNLPPFLLAGAFNLWFNTTHYVPRLQTIDPAMERAFWLTTGPVNGSLYPLGIVLVLAFARPVTRALSAIGRGKPVAAGELAAARRRALALGHGVAAVGLVLWIVAGLAFPISIHAAVGRFPAAGYLHFFLSMLACGIISCCLPFLATTWLSVRVFFPALLASGTPDAAEQRWLAALGRQSGYYLFTSPVAPLLALLLVMYSGPDSRDAMVVLVLVAIAGFAAAYVTWQRILADLAALSAATRPADLIGMTTDTVDSVAPR